MFYHMPPFHNYLHLKFAEGNPRFLLSETQQAHSAESTHSPGNSQNATDIRTSCKFEASKEPDNTRGQSLNLTWSILEFTFPLLQANKQ